MVESCFPDSCVACSLVKVPAFEEAVAPPRLRGCSLSPCVRHAERAATPGLVRQAAVSHMWLHQLWGQCDIFLLRPLHSVALVWLLASAAAVCRGLQGCLSPQGPSWVQQLRIRLYGTMASMGVRMHLAVGPGCRAQGCGPAGCRHACSCGAPSWAAKLGPLWLLRRWQASCWLCLPVAAQSHGGDAVERWGQAVRCHADDSWWACACGHSGACSDRRRGLILADTPLRGLAAGLPSQAAQCCVRRQRRLLTGTRLAVSCNAWLTAPEA